MKPTIRSIALMCGVSRGTVDRVLNDRPYVNPEVRKKVLRAVQATGYVHPHTAAKPGKKTASIGFLVAKWENDYFQRETERGIRRAQRTLRPGELSLQIERMISRSDQEYLQRIDHLLECGVSGVILNAADNLLLRTRIDQLSAQGIPVVTYNSDLPDSKRLCHIGQDLAKSGQVAAGLLARSLDAHDRILAVTGNLEFQSHRRRLNSFCTHIDHLGIARDRVQLVQCFERYDLTYNAILCALQQDNRLRGVYMGTESVPACMDAIRKAHLRYPVHVVANDLTPPARRGLKNGMLDFVVEQDFSAQACDAILVLYTYLAHGRPPKTPVRYVETSIYTKELL